MDPLAELAPSDPTWNPPNTVPPDSMVAAPPYPSAAAATPPPVDVVPQSYSPIIPSEMAPNNPDIERSYHEAGWRKILDKVGSILGGDQTIHVTKDANGNVTLTHDPSTGGEKWGRVAATALGGAAQGLANSQGPGGAARAAAAGTAFGLQQPQQREQEANAQATAEQKRMMNSAQIARLNQEVVRAAWDSKHLEPEYQQKQADWALGHAKTLEDMGAIPVAMDVTDPQQLATMAGSNPQAVGAHLGKNGEILYNEPNGKGGVNFYRLPGSVASQRTTTDDHWVEIHRDPKDPSKTIEIPHTTLAGQDTNGDRLKRQMATYVANDNVLAAVTKDNKEKVPTTSVQAIAQAAMEKDPAKKAQLEEAARAMAREEEKQKLLGRNTTTVNGYTPPQGGSPARQTTTKTGAPVWGQAWGGGDPNSAFENTSRQLALGEKTEEQLPKRGNVKGQPSIADYSNRARQITEDLFGSGTEYDPAKIAKEYKFASTEKVIAAYNAMDRLVGNPSKPDPNNPPLLDQLEAAAAAADLGPSAPFNQIKLAVQRKFGNDAAKALEFNLAETRKSLGQVTGNPTLGSSDTNLKLQQMSEAYGGDITLSNIRKVNQEAKKAIETERAAGFRNNRFLRRDYGGESIAPGQQQGTTPAAPQATPPGAAVQPPAGATMQYTDAQGNVTGWAVNGKYVAR